MRRRADAPLASACRPRYDPGIRPITKARSPGQRGRTTMSSDRITRRGFVEALGAASAAAAIAPGRAVAAANDKPRLGLIGAGSRGNQLLETFFRREPLDFEFVAVADVDDRHAGETADRIEQKQGKKPETM